MSEGITESEEKEKRLLLPVYRVDRAFPSVWTPAYILYSLCRNLCLFLAAIGESLSLKLQQGFVFGRLYEATAVLTSLLSW